MAYASLPDVSALTAKRTYGATSIPSASQVAEFLDNSAAELDSILGGKGYTLPVPPEASIALLNLRRLNAMGARVQVEGAAQVASPDAKSAAKAWDDAKKDLIAGRVQMVDLPKLGGEAFARAPVVASPFFSRDMML